MAKHRDNSDGNSSWVPSARLAYFPSPIAIYPRVDNLTSHVVEDGTLPEIPSWRNPEITATATPVGSLRLASLISPIIVICPASTTYFWPNTCSCFFFAANGWPFVKWTPVNFSPPRGPDHVLSDARVFPAPHKYLIVHDRNI
jgi:hypothetical protein